MPLAARFGDLTDHLAPLGTLTQPGTFPTGSTNVFIGGQPAWRALIDFHKCPLGVGGFVAIGSVKVLINGFPAARMGDLIVEAGLPNKITSGCPTVLIG